VYSTSKTLEIFIELKPKTNHGIYIEINVKVYTVTAPFKNYTKFCY